MTEQEVKVLMGKMESERIERTISNREDKLGPAVCYLANDLSNSREPGYILYGVDDKTGKPAGMTITDRDIQDLGNIRANGNVQPLPAMTISPVFHFPDGDVVVITVQPADFPPVRHQSKIWVRVGNRKQIASEQEERMLIEKRASSVRSFDEQPCLNAMLDDIAQETFKLGYLPHAIDTTVLERNNRPVELQLASVGFWDMRLSCPTNAGILLSGINPLQYFRGAYVQYVKFSGVTMPGSNIELEKSFSGPLLTLLKELDDFVKLALVHEKPVRQPDSFREKQVFDYPLWALRELLMNAVMHRDYASNAPIYIYEFADHIEIQNPGGLYGDVTPENFPLTSDYRNPIIAGAMKNLGFVNRFNFGVREAQNALTQNGSPAAEFDLSLGTKFLVKIFKHPTWITT
ncbi:MAG: ATP-binding protein [Bacteroidota bacterium]